MTNIEKLKKVFIDSLMVSENDLSELKYTENGWDSVGHMGLMAELEDTFNIELEVDDIIEFSSYEKGKEILSKYNIEF